MGQTSSKGEQGVGIVEAELDNSKKLVFTKTDGTKTSPLSVQGPQGPEGAVNWTGFSLENQSSLASYLVEHYSSNLKGPTGEKGEKGEKGEQGIPGTGTACIDNVCTLSGTQLAIGNAVFKNGQIVRGNTFPATEDPGIYNSSGLWARISSPGGGVAIYTKSNSTGTAVTGGGHSLLVDSSGNTGVIGNLQVEGNTTLNGNTIFGKGANCAAMQASLTTPGQLIMGGAVDNASETAFYVAGMNQNGSTYCRKI
jgi:hypothetical protein